MTYTGLYVELSMDLGLENNGEYIVPWGRLQTSSARKDIVDAMRSVEEGGANLAERFGIWCNEQTKQYA